MTSNIAMILSADGIANGAVYMLAGLGLLLIFSVTRVVFVPFGDVAAFSALSLAALQTGRAPATIGLILTLALLTTIIETLRLPRRGQAHDIPRALAAWGILPAAPCVAAWAIAGHDVSSAVRIAISVALVVPIAPLVARIALQPIADASVLVLLIMSLVLHFLLSGLGLLFFGPEGSRTQPLIGGALKFPGGYVLSGQLALMICAAFVLTGLFYLLFERTLGGKALRATAVNRVGARLVGIRPTRTGLLAYGAASLLAGLVGILVAPVTTMYYDSGFLLGLKAFVAVVIGGLVSYPLTAVGALAIGVVESFASFWSGAFKDVIVFSLLIPALMLRSFLTRSSEEEVEELDP